MNNILFIGVCLLLSTAMVCSYRPRPDDGDSSGLVGRANKRITETQGGSTYWTRQVDRHRRDVGQKRGDPFNKCCNVENSPGADAMKEKFGALAKECMKAGSSVLTKDKKAARGAMMTCMAKTLNMVDDAGNLLEDGIKAAFKEFPLPEHLKSVVDSVLTTCIAKAKENNAEAIKTFSECVSHEFMNACPKDMQDTSERCENMRAGKGKRSKSSDSEE